MAQAPKKKNAGAQDDPAKGAASGKPKRSAGFFTFVMIGSILMTVLFKETVLDHWDDPNWRRLSD